jgi:hypothetical protein
VADTDRTVESGPVSKHPSCNPSAATLVQIERFGVPRLCGRTKFCPVRFGLRGFRVFRVRFLGLGAGLVRFRHGRILCRSWAEW